MPSTKTSTKTSKPLRVIVAAAALGAALTATAPLAHAEKLSDQTIKSECKAAGGKYTKKQTVSTCTYKDIKGNTYTDFFSGEHYVDTLPW